jgi:NADH-quinone oxidoreductase subunit F
VWKGRKAKGCIPGGISMGVMTEAEFDTKLDFNGPGTVGCLGLGTAAVTVFDETTSIVDVLYNTARFFEHESCGQCTPCREGTGWMLKIADRIRRGQGRLDDLKILDEVGQNMGIMPGTTICGLADGAGWPVKQIVRKFRPELEQYIKSGEKRSSRPLVSVH